MDVEPVPPHLDRQQYGRLARAERRARSRARLDWRQRVAVELADQHGGVARRRDLLRAGLTTDDIRAEIERGVWHRGGSHTVVVHGTVPEGEGVLWRALWESTSSSVLDGASSLVVAGLEHFTPSAVDVSVPNNVVARDIDGVRLHRVRDVGPAIRTGLRRTRPEVAVLRAAEWAASDRQAATIIAMTVQQNLVSPPAVLERWRGVVASSRRELLEAVINDVCDGVHSLNELDFAALCRARGLPEPTRQAVRRGPRGRVYLDVLWEDLGLHVEIHGAHHMQGLTGIDDALRGNDIQLGDPGLVTLVVPVLGLRLQPDAFLDQVERAIRGARRRRAG
ncbi:hypothetical protein [Serinicoccus chungangensis]|uniref:hypothetical protein n=1 Tax=Serinicoccus chungangensis TaxID=767452 RepID=UPI000AAFFE0A|nr:hypothetical protein [Serinicoccus chungangensis]